MKGYYSCLKTEEAFRTELVAAAILLPLAFWVNVTVPERLWLVFSVLFVLVVELLNTAIERVVDRISMDHHDLSGQAKDMGSAAVLLALLFAGFSWLYILI